MSVPSTWRAAASVLAAAAVLAGCAGGIPKIPDSPEAILAKGEEYFQAGKYFQAQEVFKAFLARHPGHDRSDYAQFKLAESYFENKEYPLAAVEYQVLMSNYGYSEYVDDALYKVALSFWYEAPKPERDQQKAHDALNRFNQFLQTFPSSPLVDDVNAHIKEIHAQLAEKAFENGYWYFRRKKWRAAMIYFDKVIDNYPDNPHWARANYFKAIILEDRGRTEEAVRHYGVVLAYPEDVDVKNEARARLRALQR